MEASELSILWRRDFDSLLLARPALALNIMRGLSGRLRSAVRQIESLALMDVYGRIARLFLELASERDGSLVIDQGLTHQDIASMIGSSREMVSRIIKDLTRGGYIKAERRVITPVCQCSSTRPVVAPRCSGTLEPHTHQPSNRRPGQSARLARPRGEHG